MGYKSPEYSKLWYEANKTTEIAAAKLRTEEYRNRNRVYLQLLRTNTPCTDCKVLYPYYVMDFDHVTNDKIKDVTTLAHVPCSMETLQKEIDKCEIVCSNCHRERTYQRSIAE